ncbi:MAG: MBL fold metallo-hydrolase, partial [Gammaproteobacteria bacterium]
ATAILVTQGEGADLEILLVERSPVLKFFGGFWAFPGGAVDDIDRTIHCDQPTYAWRYCAVRELLEETGIVAPSLLAHAAAARVSVTDLATPEGRAVWEAILRADPQTALEFRYVCRITTPEYVPIRFATDFVHLHLESPQLLRIDQSEIINAEFIRPAVALAEWREGKRSIAPPTLLLLELLAAHGTDEFASHAERATLRMAAGAFLPTRFTPGIFLAPLRSPTLWPATTTNCMIIGTDALYVVDPAAIEAVEQQRLLDQLTELTAAGATVSGVLLTHHHRDHIGSVGVVSRHFDCPVHAHAGTFAYLDGIAYRPGRHLKEGDRIELGTAPDGSRNWHLRVYHTPGHARDHLCYIDSRYHAAIVGDMCSTLSTIVIDPPEGHMATYLHSLERLLRVPMGMLYPAHGPVQRDGPALIQQYLDHRRQRENRIRTALTEAPQSLETLLPQAYGEVAPPVHWAALRSLLAGLQKLAEDGAARETADGWIMG